MHNDGSRQPGTAETRADPADEPLFVARDHVAAGAFTEFIEGSSVGPDGALYLVGFGDQRNVARVPPASAQTLATPEVFVVLPEGSAGNGTRFDAAGNLLIADYTGHAIWRVDAGTTRVALFARLPGAHQPNDLALALDGTLYASDPDWAHGTGQIWRVRTDGTAEVCVPHLGTTNGIAVSPDGRTLYVDESVQRDVLAFDILPDGGLANRRPLLQFATAGLDGMRCDVRGNLHIARYDAGTVVVASPAGEILHEVRLRGRRPTNVAFGGPDGRTVYVTLQDRGAVEAFRTRFPGRFFHAA